MRIPFISLIAAGALTLGGCAYGDLGYGLGMGYGDPYGYDYGYSPYGYGYGSPYYGAGLGYGWYDNYYYPGTGYYVYDQYRRPRMWSDRQRSYWQSHRQVATTSGTTTYRSRPNWSGFRMRGATTTSNTDLSSDTSPRHHGHRH